MSSGSTALGHRRDIVRSVSGDGWDSLIQSVASGDRGQ